VSRLVLPAGVVLWIGSTLLLSERPWFRRVPLADRLRPFTFGAPPGPTRSGVLSVSSFRDVLTPLATVIGTRLSALFGVSEELAVRLRRIHSPVDVAEFRRRQLRTATVTFAVSVVVATALRLPGPLALLALIGSPPLSFLSYEHRIARDSARWQHRVFLELPVVSEQLGMLLSAGYSLGAALNRLAVRGSGLCSRDLDRVCTRLRQGLTEVEALREWSDEAGVPALDRLVDILALNREGGDLGGLISEEARTIRADAQRETVETIDRRAQQVWIPVTVATLVPGVLFLAVPFIEAMRLFSTGT
jgi:Flp pilus assembly protein TadB